MLVTQKMQYALRAIFELGRHYNQGPLKTAQIAETQSIPVRFLEVILNHLKKAGLVVAKRGFYGGYQLVRPPEKISVEDIFLSLDDSEELNVCVSCSSQCNCPFYGQCAFMPLWEELEGAVRTVYQRTSIQNLLDNKVIPGEIREGEG